MTKKDEQKAKSNGNGKGRMKVFVAHFDLEGGDDVLAEGFRAISHLTTMMSKGAVPAPASSPKAALLPPKKPSSATTAVEVEELKEPVLTDEAPENVVEEEDSESTESSQDKPKRKPPVPRAPKFLSELNLNTAAVRLDDFVKQKGPNSINDKYLVIAEWFKEQMKIEEITTDHIFTAFDVLGWKSQVPADPGQPLRWLKMNNYLDKVKQGVYKINWNGSNAVAKMGVAA